MKKWFYALISFFALFFLPVFCPVSFAASDDYIQGISYDDLLTAQSDKKWFLRTRYSVVKEGVASRWYSTSFDVTVANSSVEENYPAFPAPEFKEYRRMALFVGNTYSYDGVDYKSFRFAFYNDGSSKPTVISGGNQGYVNLFIPQYSRVISGGSYSGYIQTNNTFWETNIPIFNATANDVITPGTPIYDWLMYGDLSDTMNVIGYGYVGSVPVNPSDLGYIDQVQYFVDSYAYHNDQANTPEWVKWGSKSTTGVDLMDSRYYVEFMMEDKSTFLRNGANDSWLSQSGVPFASAVAFAESKLEYATSYLFPSGSDQRALLQGKASKTSLYGKASGLGSVPASAGVFKFSCATQYQAALNNDSSSDKGLFYNVVSDILSNQGNIAEKFFNNYQSSGKALNFTYDLYARIVDNTSGSAGNWLKIDRHNSPFEWSNNDRFLNGGVTSSRGHRFVNFNPETNVFKSLPDDDPVDDDDNPLPDGDPALPVPVGTGYVDNRDNSVQNIYNNYNYTYNTFYDNDLFYIDLDGKSKDTASGLIETIGLLGLLGILWSWYLALFGDLLPLWAVVLVPVFGTMFVAFLVWKFGKGLIR